MVFVREDAEEEPKKPGVVNTEHYPGHLHNRARKVLLVVVVIPSKHLVDWGKEKERDGFDKHKSDQTKVLLGCYYKQLAWICRGKIQDKKKYWAFWEISKSSAIFLLLAWLEYKVLVWGRQWQSRPELEESVAALSCYHFCGCNKLVLTLGSGRIKPKTSTINWLSFERKVKTPRKGIWDKI